MTILSVRIAGLFVTMLLGLSMVVAVAQTPQGRGPGGMRGPGGPGGPPGRGSASGAKNAQEFAAKWLTMDEDKDGKLSKAELKDTRLVKLFESADSNSDQVLEVAEMNALFESTSKARGADGPRGPRESDGGPRDGGPGGRNRRPPPGRE